MRTFQVFPKKKSANCEFGTPPNPIHQTSPNPSSIRFPSFILAQIALYTDRRSPVPRPKAFSALAPCNVTRSSSRIKRLKASTAIPEKKRHSTGCFNVDSFSSSTTAGKVSYTGKCSMATAHRKAIARQSAAVRLAEIQAIRRTGNFFKNPGKSISAPFPLPAMETEIPLCSRTCALPAPAAKTAPSKCARASAAMTAARGLATNAASNPFKSGTIPVRRNSSAGTCHTRFPKASSRRTKSGDGASIFV